jgi:hypothetical protein
VGERLEKTTHEDLHNLYASPSIIRVIKSRRPRFVGNVGGMGEMRNAYKILSENVEEIDHSEDLGVDGITSEWILYGENVRTGFILLRIGTSGKTL